ncbi:MAG: hypothetical protein NDP22_02405 [Crenarchaeota archaeon]|nr:hypothetical protein [Thermoproteota archaeon]
MASAQITFRLPPRGLLIRDFVVAAVSILLEDRNVESIRNEGDRLVVKAPLGSESYLLHQIFQVSQRIAEVKLKERGLSSPRIAGNDANVIRKFQKETNQSIAEEATLLSFASQVLEWASQECRTSTSSFLTSYGYIQEKPSTLILGGKNYAALQLFKVEKYEYGKDFLKDYKSVKMQIKHDIYWLALLMAGLSLTYSGKVKNELIFITTPEDFAFYEKEFKATTHLFFSLPKKLLYGEKRGASFIASGIKSLDPIFAFLQLLSYALVREWYKDFDFELLFQAPIQLCRVRPGRIYTLVERNIADLSPLIRFAHKLLMRGGDTTLRKIENLLRNHYSLDYSNYYSISMKLYQAISGSYNAYNLVYELGRLLSPRTVKRVFNEEDIRIIIDVLAT